MKNYNEIMNTTKIEVSVNNRFFVIEDEKFFQFIGAFINAPDEGAIQILLDNGAKEIYFETINVSKL